MGLNDNINNLNNSIKENQKQHERELKEAERKQITKYQLLDILKTEIKESQDNGQDIFNTYEQENIIDRVIKNPEISTLINQSFTRYWLLGNYNKIVKDIQRELDKEARQEEKEAKQLEKDQKEIEKEKLKLQKELQKELEAERIRKAEARKTIIEALKMTCIILLSPFMIIAFMVIAVCKDKNFK